MSSVPVTIISQGENVEARLERIRALLTELESQCRKALEDNSIKTFADGDNHLNDVLANFYEKRFDRLIDWPVFKNDLLTRWWLDLELEDNTPISTHYHVIHPGHNRLYLRHVGWVWFQIDDNVLESSIVLDEKPYRISITDDGLEILYPRASPWDVKSSIGRCPCTGGFLPTPHRLPHLTFRCDASLRWGEVPTIHAAAFQELVVVSGIRGFYNTQSTLALIASQRYGLVAEWERLAHKWCSALGNTWLDGYYHYANPYQIIVGEPDLLWQHALVIWTQLLGVDGMAWLLEVAPDTVFLAAIVSASVLTSETLIKDGIGLARCRPDLCAQAVYRILNECFIWALPLTQREDTPEIKRWWSRYTDTQPLTYYHDPKTEREVMKVVEPTIILMDQLLEPFRELVTESTDTHDNMKLAS